MPHGIFRPEECASRPGIEDKASGTQLIQDLIRDGVPAVTRYVSPVDKIARMYSVTNMIENGVVAIPETAPWLAEYLHELTTFPKSNLIAAGESWAMDAILVDLVG
jgi:predicted phage terminase large subunit-like protein